MDQNWSKKKKIKAILDMQSPKSLTQLHYFQGKVAYLGCFISNISGKFWPFLALIKNDVKYKRDECCQYSFKEIKKYLINLPVLTSLIPRKPLILYTAALDGSLGAFLAKFNEKGKENEFDYLSHCLIHYEVNYPVIKKTFLSFGIHYIKAKILHVFS